MKKNIFFSVISFLFLGLIHLVSFAQQVSKIELIQADELKFNEKENSDARRLIGNVIFKHKNTYLYCDSAHLFTNINAVDAFGHVHIRVNDSTHAYGDVLHYNGDTRIAQLDKNARLNDNQIHMTSDYITYNLESDVAQYNTGARITKGENVLTSLIGYYYATKKIFFFKENVVLTNPKYVIHSDTLKFNTATDLVYFLGPSIIEQKESYIYCENGWYHTKKNFARFHKNALLTNRKQKLTGDSLYYDRQKRFGQAFGNVVLTDTVRNSIVKGNYGEYYDETENSFVTGKALLQMIDKNKSDTLFLHADTLKTISDNSKKNKTLFAYHNMRFFKKDLQGLCDSMVYTYKDSMLTLYGKPELWSQSNQMKAELIKIRISNNAVDKIFFYNLCFVSSQYDSLRFNQIKGKEMIAYFNDNEIRRLFVRGNAETIYYILEEDSSLIGVNKTVSSKLMLHFKKNQVEKIVVLGQPDATMYPVKEVQGKDALLKGFSWEQYLRPKDKFDIFIKKNQE